MSFIVSGPLPLITDMPFLSDRAQLACWSPGWITRGWDQQHRWGLWTICHSWPPSSPHPLCSLPVGGWGRNPNGPNFPHPSLLLQQFLQSKSKPTHVSTHLQAEVIGESKRKDSPFIHLEVKNSTAKPILISHSTWRANQTAWVCRTEWKSWGKKGFACGIFTSSL